MAANRVTLLYIRMQATHKCISRLTLVFSATLYMELLREPWYLEATAVLSRHCTSTTLGGRKLVCSRRRSCVKSQPRHKHARNLKASIKGKTLRVGGGHTLGLYKPKPTEDKDGFSTHRISHPSVIDIFDRCRDLNAAKPCDQDGYPSMYTPDNIAKREALRTHPGAVDAIKSLQGRASV